MSLLLAAFFALALTGQGHPVSIDYEDGSSVHVIEYTSPSCPDIDDEPCYFGFTTDAETGAVEFIAGPDPHGCPARNRAAASARTGTQQTSPSRRAMNRAAPRKARGIKQENQSMSIDPLRNKRDSVGRIIPDTVRDEPVHKYRCDTCPFATSDEQAKRGHEDFLVNNPRGWLGHGEAHHTTVVCPTCISIGTGMGPSHNASRRCESGGRNHCTCDTCF